MRDIKFRGQHIISKKWIVGDLIHEEWIGGKAIMIKRKKTAHSVLEETIGQFTGLHDKGGKEIYEGDRVYIVPEDEYGEVKWDNETTRFLVIYNEIVTDFDNWYGYDLEVVGTIYDS